MGIRGSGFVQFGTVLNYSTTTPQKCEAVPRRACIQGSQISVSLNSRIESNTKQVKKMGVRVLGFGEGTHRFLLERVPKKLPGGGEES